MRELSNPIVCSAQPRQISMSCWARFCMQSSSGSWDVSSVAFLAFGGRGRETLLRTTASLRFVVGRRTSSRQTSGRLKFVFLAARLHAPASQHSEASQMKPTAGTAGRWSVRMFKPTHQVPPLYSTGPARRGLNSKLYLCLFEST